MRICPTASSELFGLAAPEFTGAAIVMLRFRAEKSPPRREAGKRRGRRGGARRGVAGEEKREGKRGKKRKGEDGRRIRGRKRGKILSGRKKIAPGQIFLLDKRVKKVI